MTTATTQTPIVVALAKEPNFRGAIARKCLTRFTLKGSRSWSGVGYVAEGESGVQVHGGPMVPGPWAYGFPLCHVLDNHGGTGAEQQRLREAGLLLELEGGELVEIDGTLYQAVIERRGRDAWLSFTAAPAEVK